MRMLNRSLQSAANLPQSLCNQKRSSHNCEGEDDRGQSFQLSFQLQRHCKFGFVDSGSALGVEVRCKANVQNGSERRAAILSARRALHRPELRNRASPLSESSMARSQLAGQPAIRHTMPALPCGRFATSFSRLFSVVGAWYAWSLAWQAPSVRIRLERPSSCRSMSGCTEPAPQ